ncbi:MAG: fumarylacetoacetate hydrolase family protein [Bacteroidota bacterium]|nr:fumarylacetoacetate hydrolase family protein [Bacteroidota bacterium]
MKFVTFKGSVQSPKYSAATSFKGTLGDAFSVWNKDVHHPLAPIGRLGFLIGDHIVDVESASLNYAMRMEEKQIRSIPSDIITLLALGEEALQRAIEVHEWCSKRSFDELNNGYQIAWKLGEAQLYAPVPRPTSMRDGYAFRQHVEAARRNRGVEMIPEFDEFPVFYFTNHQAVIGPGEMSVMPEQLKKLDFELEAAIVIGKEGRNISAEHADEYIFGYMVMNDWSARALQMEEMKLSLRPAKGKDFATAIGPYLVTKDELVSRRIPGPKGERYDLTMTCRIGTEEVSRGNLKDMTWTFAQIIERASYGVTLYPGDVIGSGTVGTGCFLELNGSKVYDNRWVKPGEEVTCSIEMLGDLTNRVVAEK